MISGDLLMHLEYFSKRQSSRSRRAYFVDDVNPFYLPRHFCQAVDMEANMSTTPVARKSGFSGVTRNDQKRIGG